MTDRQNIAVLVNSCDLYEDTWYPFFKLLKKNWTNHPENIFLNSETKEYKCDFMDVKTFCFGKDISWTKRVRECVKRIKQEYILVFLEDYFLVDKVNEELFEEAYDLIKNNKKIGGIYFDPSNLNHFYDIKVDTDDNFVEAAKDNKNRAYVKVTLFRKDFYLKLLCMEESPWLYERNSYTRSLASGYKVFIQNQKNGEYTFTYYLKVRDDIGVSSNKWRSGTIKAFEANGITDVNYDRLGVLEPYDNKKEEEKSQSVEAKDKKKSLKEKIYLNFIKKIKASRLMIQIQVLKYKLYYRFIYKNN